MSLKEVAPSVRRSMSLRMAGALLRALDVYFHNQLQWDDMATLCRKISKVCFYKLPRAYHLDMSEAQDIDSYGLSSKKLYEILGLK